MQVSYVGPEQDETKDQRPNQFCQQQERHQHLWQHYIQQSKASHGFPHTKGLSESLKNIYSKHKIQVYFRVGQPSETS